MTKFSHYSEFPDIDKYASAENLDYDVLVKAFEVEEKYHKLLMNESDFKKRVRLYDEFYSTLIPIYGRDSSSFEGKNPKTKYVKLFAKELKNSSIIDYGCGQGFMLQSIADTLSTKRLTGVDVFIPNELKSHPSIQFVESNIITYKPDYTYDIAFSDNVLEHLVPIDAETHLRNIYQSLKYKGKLIIIMPNKLFGPWDVTRIKDYSQTGKTDAQGGHVNESTHNEMVATLENIGYTKFSTILPIPKLKYLLFRHARINSQIIQSLENSPLLMKMIKGIRMNGESILKFPVLLIAEK